MIHAVFAVRLVSLTAHTACTSSGAEVRGCSSALPSIDKPPMCSVVTATAVSARSVSAASRAVHQLCTACMVLFQVHAHPCTPACCSPATSAHTGTVFDSDHAQRDGHRKGCLCLSSGLQHCWSHGCSASTCHMQVQLKILKLAQQLYWQLYWQLYHLA